MRKAKKKNMTVQRSLFFKRLRIDLRDNWTIYLMVLIPLVWLIVFCYVPMSGIQLAFKTFKAKLGIWGSPWIGFKNFERFFKSYSFGTILWNTISINVYSLVVGFPIPIVFALFLNYLRHRRLKKTVQMVSYAPYFISTVVMCGMITIFMSTDSGQGYRGGEPAAAAFGDGWGEFHGDAGLFQGYLCVDQCMAGHGMVLHHLYLCPGRCGLSAS